MPFPPRILLAALALATFPCAAVAQFTDDFATINPAWIPDRYHPAGFSSVIFQGGGCLALTIDQSGSAANRSAQYSSTFYDTQGESRPGGITGLWTLSAQVFVSSAFNTTTGTLVRSDLWGNAGTPYMVLGFVNDSPTDENNPAAPDRAFRFQVFHPTTGNWINIGVPNGFVFDTWHTLSGTWTGTALEYRIDGTLVLTISTTGGDDLGTVSIEGNNFGQAGSYTVHWANLIASGIPVPVITNSPLTAAGTVGTPFVFAMTASGYPTSYAASPLPPGLVLNSTTGAITGTPTTVGATAVQLGATNATGTGDATLTITVAAAAAPIPPSITIQPASQTVNAGGNTTLSVTAASATGYQWQLNGTSISGATNSTLTLANIGTTQRGGYTAVVSNVLGSVTSNAANVAVAVNSSLYNISSRAYIGTGQFQNLVAGFYTNGSGSKNVVVRGIGPNLAIVSPPLAGLTLANPKLTWFNASATVLGTNTAWGGGATLTNAFANVYGASLQPNSNDTALFMSVPAGPGIGYTAEVDGLNNGSGVSLVEIYDYDSYVGTPASRLINISSRAVVGTGNQSLVAGFYIIGSGSQTLLIRAVGPGLAGTSAFVGLTLVKPTLTLYDASGNVVATNIGWGNTVTAGNSTAAAGIQSATTAIMSSVYASTIASGSNDCAMVVTLPTGGNAAGYTAQVSSADTTTGLALVEVYNVP